MAAYVILTRLHAGADYSKRRQETDDTIRSYAMGQPVWDEPTSAHVLQSGLTAAELCDSIYFKAPIYEDRDLLAVINLSMKGAASYAARGLEMPYTLAGLMDAR